MRSRKIESLVKTTRKRNHQRIGTIRVQRLTMKSRKAESNVKKDSQEKDTRYEG